MVQQRFTTWAAGGLAVLAAALGGAVPASAQTAPDVTVVVTPGHALPVASVDVAVTIAGCTPTKVTAVLDGNAATGDETSMLGTQAEAAAQPDGTWRADLVVPAGLAAPQALTLEGDVVCADGSRRRGTTPFAVDGFLSQVVSVSPRTAHAGDRVQVLMTDGRGSCWHASVTDSRGSLWSLWLQASQPAPPLLNPTVDYSDQPGRISASFVVPRAMALGRATVDVHCSQTKDHVAFLEVAAAASPSTSAPAPPSAATTSARPQATAASAATASAAAAKPSSASTTSAPSADASTSAAATSSSAPQASSTTEPQLAPVAVVGSSAEASDGSSWQVPALVVAGLALLAGGGAAVARSRSRRGR
ncbi:MAG: hypothetical protein ACTHQ3_19755 [Motilibacteraceae bacterium]